MTWWVWAGIALVAYLTLVGLIVAFVHGATTLPKRGTR